MFCTKEVYLVINPDCGVHCNDLQGLSWKFYTFEAAAKWVLRNDSHPCLFTLSKPCLAKF